MNETESTPKSADPKKARSFRRAVFRGLGLVMPPLLTIVLFLWVWNIVELNVLKPMESAAHRLYIMTRSDIHDAAPPGVSVREDAENGQRISTFVHEGVSYVRLGDGQFVNHRHFEEFQAKKSRQDKVPADADDFYRRLAQLKFPRRYLLPIALVVFIFLLYALGRFVAFSIGRVLWNATEGIVTRLPVIRNVYSSVKQVTDLVFSDRDEAKFTRVVAIEYPRKGIWAMAFVTGEGFADIRAVAQEPIVAVLVPTSPMPAAGFTAMLRKSDTVELNITIDQAIQYMVSCGVVAPPYSLTDDRTIIAQHFQEKITGKKEE